MVYRSYGHSLALGELRSKTLVYGSASLCTHMGYYLAFSTYMTFYDILVAAYDSSDGLRPASRFLVFEHLPQIYRLLQISSRVPTIFIFWIPDRAQLRVLHSIYADLSRSSFMYIIFLGR